MHHDKEQTMKRWRNLSAGVVLALVAFALFTVGLSLTAA